MCNLSIQKSKLLLALLGGVLLTACGGGASTASPVAAPNMTTNDTPPSGGGTIAPPIAATPPVTSDPNAPPTTSSPPPTGIVPPPDSPPPVVVAPPPSDVPPEGSLVIPGANIVTDVRFQSTAAADQANVPVTFGQVFAAGNVSAAQSITGRLADGSVIPLQVDVKARHPDGSLRHAIVSAVLPKLLAGQTLPMALATVAAPAAPAASTPAALLAAGFSAQVKLTLGGQLYTASADALLRSGKYQTWMSGAVANEWLASVPLTTADGVAHPHLSARFAVRAINGANRARVDVTVENDWAYEAAPQNFVYDAQILVGGQSVYTKSALTHFHQARWRKVFWWGGEPAVHIRHNVGYLIASRALPNFDRSVTFTETNLAALQTRWNARNIEPMGTGMATPYMPTTGGRDDLGLLPGWAATYLLTMDKRAKDVTLGTADLAGSYSSHYRNKTTDRPVSLVEFPYMTIYGNRSDTVNPATKLQEAFPLCATTTACTTTTSHDASHQPAFAYLPYLVTGDYYYLEELQFWTMWNTFSSNPYYRQFTKGLFQGDQVRGQGWSMRTLAEAAYITPDNDPFKAQFAGFMQSNLDWYNSHYTNNADANTLGALTHGYAIVYHDGTGLAPWMDDFFTSAIGHVSELGFADAKPLLAWKAKFPILRMTSPDACWINGAIYSLKVRDSSTSPVYATMGEAYRASQTALYATLACAGADMAASLGLRVGEMTGYSSETTGFPSNMQPALAYAADSGAANGGAAWSVFMGRTVKPNYALGPQFAIVPR